MQKVQLSDLPAFARQIVERIEKSQPADRAYLLALVGDLGAGKTTFTQALAKELWITDTIQSPTYVLMKSYPVPTPPPGGWLTTFVHIDAYRLEKPEEFLVLRPEKFLHDPHTLVVVEWPERLEGYLPPADLTLHFSSDTPVGQHGVAGDKERYIEVLA